MAQGKTHDTATRLYNNAGIMIPLCYNFSRQGLLDLDKSRWTMSHDRAQITCKHCIRIRAKHRFA